jgi:hypothetical protein
MVVQAVYKEKINQKTISLYSIIFDWVVWSIITISLISIITLVLGLFVPKIVFFVGIASSILLTAYRLRSYTVKPITIEVQLLALLFLIVFALIFRLEPYPWIHGGQDQGVYVSMSAYFQREGQIFIEDAFLKDMPPNQIVALYLDNQNEGEFMLPGVYYGGNKDYYFQFYHLHPLWMAISADVLGTESRFYSLTFFSLLSIIGSYLLVINLTKSLTAAFFTALILAANPLHAFFSKWPVTEVMVLALSFLGFFYLYRSWHIAANQKRIDFWYLALSIFSFSLQFFVRISGFIFVPLLFIFLWAGIWLTYRGKSCEGIVFKYFSLYSLIIYSGSVIYGLCFSSQYSINIYNNSFSQVFGPSWVFYIFLLIVILLFFTAAFYCLTMKRVENKHFSELCEKYILKFGTILLVIAIIVAAGIGLYKAYQLGYTDYYESSFYNRFGLSASGKGVFLQSSITNWIIYTSPFLLISAFIMMFRSKWDWHHLVMLFLIASVLIPNFAFRLWVIPYQYYYARYLLSEAVPYSIVLCMIIIFENSSQRIGYLRYGAIVLTIIFYIILSSFQIGVEEGKRSYKILNDIAFHVDSNDLLLLDQSGWSHNFVIFQTPLVFYHGLKVFPVVKQGDVEKVVNEFNNLSIGELWLLSPELIYEKDYSLHKKYIHYDRVMERSRFVPLKQIEDYCYQELYLYKIPFDSIIKSVMGDAGRWYDVRDKLQTQIIMGNGWHNIESSHVWSSEKAEIIVSTDWFSDGFVPAELVMRVQAYGASPNRQVEVVASNNGVEYVFTFIDSETKEIIIPLSLNSNLEVIEISVPSATSPAELENSLDGRILGIALQGYMFR